MTTSDEPTLVGPPPPAVGRDRVAQSWVAVATTSWFGDAVFAIALAWTAVRLLSPAIAGLVLGIETLPQAVLMLAGGVIADRLDTRRVMIVGETARSLVLLAAVAAWWSGANRPAVLFAVAVAFGIAAGLSNPARATLARQLVGTADLVAVGGWIQVGSRLARLAGSPVGAVVVATGGLGPAMLIDAGSFALVAIVLVLVVRPRYSLPRSTGLSWHEGLRDGIAYLATTPAARWMTFGVCSLNVFTTPVVGVGVALCVARSGWGPSWIGLAEAVFAAGAIVGSLVAIRWRPDRLATRAFWLLVVQGAALAVVGVPTRTTLVAAMVVVGVTAGIASVWISGVYQATIAPGHLGRVSAVSQLGDLTLTPLVLPLFGMIVAGTDVLGATSCCGLAMAVLCLFFARRPAIRGLGRRPATSRGGRCARVSACPPRPCRTR